MIHPNIVLTAVVHGLHTLPTPRMNVNVPPYAATPDTRVIDLGMDSLDWVEFCMEIEDYEGMDCSIPDDLVLELVRQSEISNLTVKQFSDLLAARLNP